MSNLKHDDIFKAIITITEEYDNMIHFAGVFNTRSANIKFVAYYNSSVYKSEVSESRHADSYFADIIGGDSFVFDFHIPFADSGDINFFIQGGVRFLSYPTLLYLTIMSIRNHRASLFSIAERAITILYKEVCANLRKSADDMAVQSLDKELL